MPKRNLSIIGNGMAGARLLEDLLRRNAHHQYSIHVFGDEPTPAYNRMLLSRVLAGEDPDTIRFEPDASRFSAEVTFHRSIRIERIDTATRHLVTVGGESFPYDIAVIATGSRSFTPPITGLHLPEKMLRPGVYSYRTLDDCLQMRSAARPGKNAVVLGGGLLGLEAAKVLSDTGLHVTVVHLASHLMETQLDPAAGAVLQIHIQRTGIYVRTGTTLAEVCGDQQVEAVKLSDGSLLPADMVVLACGIRPNVDLAKASSVPVGRAILVNDTLATSIPGIYALGECAEHRGKCYGLVAPINEQSVVLADILTGANPRARYLGSSPYTRLKVAGIDVASMGLLQAQLPEDKTITVAEDSKPAYRKLVLRDNQLIGAQFVGDTTGAATCAQILSSTSPAYPTNPLELLCDFSATAAVPMDREICNCRKVMLSQIQAAISEGATTPDELSKCTGAGTGCGSCKAELSRLCSAAAQHV